MDLGRAASFCGPFFHLWLDSDLLPQPWAKAAPGMEDYLSTSWYKRWGSQVASQPRHKTKEEMDPGEEEEKGRPDTVPFSFKFICKGEGRCEGQGRPEGCLDGQERD